MVLTSEYQYVGRTNSVSSNDGIYQYYVLLYAKTTGSMSTGKHTVSIKTRMACTSASSFYEWPTKGYIKANGKSVKEWDMQPYPSKAWNTTAITEGGVKYLQWVDMMEVSTTVDTGYGVTKDIAIETSWTMQGGNGAGYLPKPNSPCAVSISVTLPMIAGASTITSAADITIGKACSVKWTPLSSSFCYKLRFSVGGWSYTTGAIAPKTTSAYTYAGYTIPMEVATQITTAPSGNMKVEMFSYTDSTCKTQIGSADEKTVKATVPDNTDTKPSVSMSLSVVSDLASTFAGLYIQNLTKLKADISAGGMYGASIAKTQAYIGGTKFSGTSSLITHTGEVTVTGEATDSRGYVGETEKVITVIPYARPALVPASGETGIVCVRCDAGGNYSNSGTYLRIKAKRDYSPVTAGGVQKNFCEIRYRVNGGAWTTILSRTAATDEVDTGAISGVVSSVTSSYNVEVGVVDDVGNSSSTKFIIPTESVTFSLRNGGQGAAFGEYSVVEKVLAIAADWELRVKGSVSGVAPDGFGLGGSAVHYDDLNNATKCGWWTIENGDLNRPFDYGMGMTVNRYGGRFTQIALNPFMAGTGEICVRSHDGSAWQPWEYINPPMKLGVEYRTTERYLGVPVYTKVIDFGALPASTSKQVAIADGAYVAPIGVTLVLSDGCVINGYGKDRNFSSAFGIYVDNTHYNVRVTTEADFSSLSGKVIVKYIKD